MAVSYISRAKHNDREYKRILKRGAATDSKHDLDVAFTNIYTSAGFKRIGAPEDVEESGEDLFATGWRVIESVIEDPGNLPAAWTSDIPKVGNTKVKGNIRTKSGFVYNLRMIRISKDTAPDTLYDFITDQPDLYFINDATTGPFNEVLRKKRAGGGSNRSITHIVNREAISDPSGKPNENEGIFKRENQADRVIKESVALEDPDVPANKQTVVYSAWDKRPADAPVPYEYDFFSRLDVSLSPVEYSGYKATTLTFQGMDSTDFERIETSAAGKKTNSRSAMIEYLKKIYASIAGSIRNEERKKKEFDYFTSLQKKRSGDSLMTLSYYDMNRAYKSNNGEKFTFKTKMNRYLLSHDTFNTVPNSLTNGADIVYLGAEMDGSQIVYVFNRDGGKGDLTQVFFDWAKENTASIKGLFDGQEPIFSKKEREYTAIINAKVDEINKYLNALPKDSDISVADKTQVNNYFKALLKELFKYSVFTNIFKTDFNTAALNIITPEKTYASCTEPQKTKIIDLKNRYYAQLSKDPMYTNIATKFEAPLEKNATVTQINRFEILEFGSARIRNAFVTSRCIIGSIPELAKGIEKFAAKVLSIFDTIDKNEKLAGAANQNFKNTWEFFLEQRGSAPTEASLPSAELLSGVNENITGADVVRVYDSGAGITAASKYSIPFCSIIRTRAQKKAEAALARIEMAENAANPVKTIQAGGDPNETSDIVIYAFMLQNLVESFENYYSEEDLDNYGEALPLVAQLVLLFMKNAKSLVDFFDTLIRILKYSDDKFEEEFGRSILGGRSLSYVVPGVERLIDETFGTEILTKLQDRAITHEGSLSLPKMRVGKLRNVNEKIHVRIKELIRLERQRLTGLNVRAARQRRGEPMALAITSANRSRLKRILNNVYTRKRSASRSRSKSRSKSKSKSKSKSRSRSKSKSKRSKSRSAKLRLTIAPAKELVYVTTGRGTRRR